jgi:hypothetical protein
MEFRSVRLAQKNTRDLIPLDILIDFLLRGKLNSIASFFASTSSPLSSALSCFLQPSSDHGLLEPDAIILLHTRDISSSA